MHVFKLEYLPSKQPYSTKHSTYHSIIMIKPVTCKPTKAKCAQIMLPRVNVLISVLRSPVAACVCCVLSSSQCYTRQPCYWAGVYGATPWAQQQDQLCQGTQLQRDPGLLRHPGHCGQTEDQGETQKEFWAEVIGQSVTLKKMDK